RHTRFSRDWSSDVCSSDLSRVKVGPGAQISADSAVDGQGGEVELDADEFWPVLRFYNHLRNKFAEIRLSNNVISHPNDAWLTLEAPYGESDGRLGVYGAANYGLQNAAHVIRISDSEPISQNRKDLGG